MDIYIYTYVYIYIFLMSHDPTFSKALEFQIFKNPMWSFFYIFSVAIFMIHACLGWKKVTPVLGIPRGHIQRVEILGFLDRDRDRIGIQGWPGTRLGQLILDWNDFFWIGLSWIKIDFCFSLFFWEDQRWMAIRSPSWPWRMAMAVDFIAMESIAEENGTVAREPNGPTSGGNPSLFRVAMVAQFISWSQFGTEKFCSIQTHDPLIHAFFWPCLTLKFFAITCFLITCSYMFSMSGTWRLYHRRCSEHFL